MASRGLLRRLALLCAATLACACYEQRGDSDPRSISVWVSQCEARCGQQESCDNDQFLFDHGNMTLCENDCGYYLETGANEAFVAGLSDSCLRALWNEVGCVYSLGCDDLEEWETNSGDPAPCGEQAEARESECAGVDLEAFLEDCDWPESVDYWV
jgi:hypothetical protein